MEPTEKICPLLMIAKACRRREELKAVSPQCMGEACAWYQKNSYKKQFSKELPAGWCILAGPRD